MKKILSLVLAMLMIISMVPAVFAADASESDYQAAIDYLKTIGLYVGYGDGEDGADDQVLRYQMALFTARMVTGRVDKAYWATEENDSGFTDVDALDEEALGGVSYAAQQGIVNGIGGGEFAPYDNVTYRDAIVMIVRALGFNYPASGYPWSYINKARELGVLDGISGVTYTVEVKREVIAQLLYNALNAEIKGATLAETAFGVAETIVMVTATTDIAYGKGASKAQKTDYVKVAALDAQGEPFGTEYYVPYADLGLTAATANAAVGTTFAVTHKDNFTKVLASKSLSKVFENTTSKKEVKYTFDNKIQLGRAQYTILAPTAGYSNLNNNQGTITGTKEIKVFKAFGAKSENLIPADAQYLMGADGNIYDVTNPFKPYAYYSALINAYFTYDETNKTFTKLSAEETADLLALTSTTVEGFTNIGADAYINTQIASDWGVTYDYFKAIASDINGDGVYDRVIIRPYELFRLVSKTSDGKKATIATYTTTVNDAAAAVATTSQEITIADWRQTGINLSTVSDGSFFVAYMADGKAKERELEIVEVVNGAKADDEDKTYVFSAYLRGYDATTNSVIFGSNYETLPFGYMGVMNTTAYVPSQTKNATTTTSATANFLRPFWNTYVTMHVLNGKIIMVERADEADNYVVVKSFVDFTEDGLKAIALSTLTDGEADITISELNGWNLGGFDYELYKWLKDLANAGLKVEEYPLPIKLNTVYKVRYVAEDGSYNLVEATPYAEDKDIYVNNFGYILGVDKDGVFGSDKRVATADKDLWIILQGDQVHLFKGKLSTVELTGLDFYKAKGNQFVAEAPVGTNLGPIYGNVNQGVDYWMYNYEVDMYYNKYYYANFNYGHYMTNMRTGVVEFVTYDSALATAGFNGKLVPMTEGAIYKATDKVISEYSLNANKEVVIPTYSLKEVAGLEFATGKYFGKKYETVAVGAVIPEGLNLQVAIENDILTADINAAYNSYEALVDAIAENMYEVIYDRDFENDFGDTNPDNNVSSWAAIKADLLKKVTFVDYAAGGVRTAWAAVSDKGVYASKTFGTESTYVKAYVMYDYANASAKVFVDSANAVEPQDAVITTQQAATVTGVSGVTATATVASNLLANATTIKVEFSDKAYATEITVGDYEFEVVDRGVNYVTVKIASPEFEGAISVVTKEFAAAADKLTGLAAAADLELESLEGDNPGCLNFYQHVYNNVSYDFDTYMYDGDTTGSTTGYADSYTVLKYHSFADKYNAQLKHEAGAKYFGAFVTKLAAVEDLTALRMYAYTNYGTTNSLFDDFDVLVSADGENWTVAASVTDLVAAGAWVIEGNNYVVELALTGADDVQYVALAPTDYNGFGHSGNGQYQFICEFELYK